MTSVPLHRNRRVLATLAVLGVVLVAGFFVSGGIAGDTTPSVDANVTERYRSVDVLSATQTVTIRTDDSVTSRSVADVTLVPDTDRRRLQFRNRSAHLHDLLVSNGSMLWFQDSANDSVVAIQLSQPPADARARTGARLQRLVVDAGLADDAGTPQSVGVSPLPVVPRHAGVAPSPDANRSYTAEFVRTDTVGDREAYVLDITPSTEAETNYSQRLWLDTERFYPLRTQTAWTTDDGAHRSVTTTYTDVTFDADVNEETFRPDIDSETTVERPSFPDRTWYRSSDALRAASSMTVPEPTVPATFELSYATQTTGRIEGVGLEYTDGARELSVAKFNYTLDIDAEERDVTIDGQPATFDDGPTVSLSWNCNGYGYTVRGTGVERSQLLETARSVGCPA